MMEQHAPYPPYASLILIGEDLDPASITETLGITPTDSFKKGDKRGKRGSVWRHGYWSLESTGWVKSADPVAHVSWLLEQLEPAKLKLRELSMDDSMNVEISLFWIMASTHEVFEISPGLAHQIAALRIRLELSVYAPLGEATDAE